jgi:MSHA biogenesis protein MshJ
VKLWTRYLNWFAGLKDREQKIVAAAILLGGLFAGYTYGIEPNLLKAKQADKAIAEATGSASQLSQQATGLQNLNRDPDAPLRSRLTQLNTELAGQDQRYAAVQNSLVSAQQMPALLESYLARSNALQLLSLRTLPPAPVIERKDKVISAVGEKVATAAQTMTASPNLFKHGVELKLAGTYPELVAYVRALENAPQRLLWGQMELVTLDYPRSQLTLTVYTLSLDKSWMVL